MNKSYHYNWGFWGLVLMLMTSCHGIFGGIFDDPDSAVTPYGHSIFLDASNWDNWYYIDFSGDPTDCATAYPIPRHLTGEWDGKSSITTNLYEVFDRGLDFYEQVRTDPADSQPEPDAWDIAIHRDNVRTNGGSVFETAYSSIDDLPDDLDCLSLDFVPDEFDTGNVWVVQDSMMNGYVGCQAIKINKVLSGWLRFMIPPIPPSYTYNGHVYIYRAPDGRLIALRLANYQDAYGTKCKMTIEYKFL